jgi:hypothetical protein
VRDLMVELRPQEVYGTGAFEPHADHSAVGRPRLSTGPPSRCGRRRTMVGPTRANPGRRGR